MANVDDMLRKNPKHIKILPDLSDGYIAFLSLILLGYSIFGKGFAYLGVPPLFIGEVVLLLGVLVFLSSGCLLAVLASLPMALLTLSITFALFRTLPYLTVYGIDALRDSVVVIYGTFAFVILAMLLANPARLNVMLARYAGFCLILVFLAPFFLFISSFALDSLPNHWAANVPLVQLRAGEAAVHLAGVAIFAAAGFIRTSLLWQILVIVGVAIAAAAARAALLAFFIPFIIAIIAYGQLRRLLRYVMCGAVALSVIITVGSQLDLQLEGSSHHGRTPTIGQIAENVSSLFVEKDESLNGTASWRLEWWGTIIDYTVFGEKFWTGRGYGINLSESDGFADGETGGSARPGQPPTRSPHNVHMTILARSGVPGFVLWCSVLIGWYIALIDAFLFARRRGEDQWVKLFIFIACYGLAFLINASFDVALEGPMQGIWFWCLFGFGLGAAMIYRARYAAYPLSINNQRDTLQSGRGQPHSAPGLMGVFILFCMLWILLEAPSARAAPANQIEIGPRPQPCPRGAVDVWPGQLNQELIERYGERTAFCLKNGIHRLAVIRPLREQKFHGEGRSILVGTRILQNFKKQDVFWVAEDVDVRFDPYGQCHEGRNMCNRSERVFLDDTVLAPAASKDLLSTSSFFIDHEEHRLYLTTDPTGKTVEITAARFAFRSKANDVLISNLIIEKYATRAQSGAIHGTDGKRWTVINSVARLNSGHGINIGDGSRVIASEIYQNGQLGIGGMGNDILITQNSIWGNNVYGFKIRWEAGGVKLARSENVILRDNHVYDNIGAGLWCDIECRDVLYEGNVVERNHRPGIFHEISFAAVIQNNVLRHNSISDNGRWFWGTEILIAGSQDVVARHNSVLAPARGCGIILIDQSRSNEKGEKYKTKNNIIENNDIRFEGAVCNGGVSDTSPHDVNYSIIADGNNIFDRNTYHVRDASQPSRFVWERQVYDWIGFRNLGLEKHSALIFF